MLPCFVSPGRGGVASASSRHSPRSSSASTSWIVSVDPQLLRLHHQVTHSEQLEGVVEGFKSCMPFYTRWACGYEEKAVGGSEGACEGWERMPRG